MTLEIDLHNHVAVVTGASGQLGRVMARTLARCGAKIAIHYHQNREQAESLQNELTQLKTPTCLISGDVGNFDAVIQMKNSVNKQLGPADIIVANAVSQILPWSPVLEEDISDYENQFKTCVMQNVHLAKAFIPDMITSGWGRYVGINTECAMQTAETQSAYASAKRGMDGILRVLAKEVGPHQITVNQVAPGWTISDKVREDGSEYQEQYQSTIPLRRRGTDQEVANVVAFLASDLASYITGAYIPVCGGNVMPTI